MRDRNNRLAMSLILLHFLLSIHVQSFLFPHPQADYTSTAPSAPFLSAPSSHRDDSGDLAEPLPLSAEDLERLSELKFRHVPAMPIMILDAMLPRQRLTFRSSDPRFRRLVEYCVDDHGDVYDNPHRLGMLGLNPYTGKPLCRGVTVSISVVSDGEGRDDDKATATSTIAVQHNDVDLDSRRARMSQTKAITLSIRGERRIEVQGQPWLDDSGSFYLADVEVVGGDNEFHQSAMTTEQWEEAEGLSQTLPSKLREWMALVVETGVTDQDGMNARLMDLGEMPTSKRITDRAMWTAALVNPLPALGVCLEIRPAMLSCSNALERTVLACQAVQSSIDHMRGKRRLF